MRLWRWLTGRRGDERDPTFEATRARQREVEARLQALGVEAEVRGRGRWLPK